MGSAVAECCQALLFHLRPLSRPENASTEQAHCCRRVQAIHTRQPPLGGWFGPGSLPLLRAQADCYSFTRALLFVNTARAPLRQQAGADAGREGGCGTRSSLLDRKTPGPQPCPAPPPPARVSRLPGRRALEVRGGRRLPGMLLLLLGAPVRERGAPLGRGGGGRAAAGGSGGGRPLGLRVLRLAAAEEALEAAAPRHAGLCGALRGDLPPAAAAGGARRSRALRGHRRGGSGSRPPRCMRLIR